MPKDLTNELYNKMQKKIVNEDIVNPELRDIYNVVIKTLKKLPDLIMLGYRKEPINPEKRFRIEMDDVIRKKGQNRNKDAREYIDFSVDLNDTRVDILRCYFIISPKLISDSAKETALTNTKYRIMESTEGLDVVFHSELKDEILNRDDEYDSTKEDDKDLDLLLEVPILMPRLINGQYYLLDGRKFFSAFYMQRVGRWTSTGKLEVSNIMPRPYDGKDEIKNYIWIDEEDNTIRYQFLGKILNPFALLGSDIKLHKDFPEFFHTKKEPTEEGKTLQKTYNLWKRKEKKEFLKERADHLDDDEKKDYKFKLIEQVSSEEIVNAIHNLLVPDDRTVLFDIHKSLKKFLKIEILERIPNFRGSRRAKADIVKSRVNINPEVVLMTMKKRKQFSSTVADSVNTIDIYNQFAYISELDSGSKVGDGPRRYRQDQLGIVDPIATSTNIIVA